MLHNLKQVLGAAGKTAEIVDIDGIALPHIVEHCLELWPVHALATDFFREPLFDAVLFERFDLARFILLFGADADICNFHGSTSLTGLKNRVRDKQNF